jgi:DnaJ-domain-containing protein 1
MANPGARAQRDKATRDRVSRVHKDRDDRETKQRAAADEAFRKMKEQAARGGPIPSSSWSSTSSSSTGSSGPRPPRPGSQDAQLADWYRVLDLQAGADMAQIKTSYRQLMRKYHPDMHAGNPGRQKAATELSMRVTAAYNGLVTHLESKK